jgi:hypothetical protein
MNQQAIIDAIMNAKDPNMEAAEWIRQLDDDISQIVAFRDSLYSVAYFATDTGDIHTIDPKIANWLHLATSKEFSGDRAKIQKVAVSEYKGRLWIVAADGIRLHAHAISDVATGTYAIYGNKIRLAAEQEYPNWRDIMPVAPIELDYDCYFLVDSDDFGQDEIATWWIDGNVMATPATARAANYGINFQYLHDAWSLCNTEPTYAKAALGNKEPLLLRWPDAFAMIMPMRPDAYGAHRAQW